MHRWSTLTFGLLFVAAIVGLVLSGRQQPPSKSPAVIPSASAAPLTSAKDPVPADAGAVVDATPESAESSEFHKLADGGMVPPLAANAPSAVTLGVVLFQYRGAEGAPSQARTKAEARKQADQLMDLAKKDFDEAIKRGDPGSLANTSAIPRNVLEPLLEYVVFSLDKGEVYGEPLDTPRGFWIVRRVK